VSWNGNSWKSMTRYRERRWWRWAMVIGPREAAAEMFKYKYLLVVIYSVVVLKWYSRKLTIGSQAKLVRCDPHAAISSTTASSKLQSNDGVSANSRNLEGPLVEESVFVRVSMICGDKYLRYKPSKATSHRGNPPDRAPRTSTSVSKSRSKSTFDSARYFSLVSDINNGTGNPEKNSNSTSFTLSILNTRSKAARMSSGRSAQLAPLELNFKPNEYK